MDGYANGRRKWTNSNTTIGRSLWYNENGKWIIGSKDMSRQAEASTETNIQCPSQVVRWAPSDGWSVTSVQCGMSIYFIYLISH